MFPLKVNSNDLFSYVFINLPQNDFSDTINYFNSIIALSSKFDSPIFIEQINGFYLSKFNDQIRFSFFLDNKNESIKFIEDFFISNNYKINGQIKEPHSETFNEYRKNIKSNLEFRRFLQLMTNVGLDLLKYDVMYSRKMVAKYRLEIVPNGLDVREYFDNSFQKSKYYISLSTDNKNELLNGLSFWCDDNNDWAHMLVVMLLPGDLKSRPKNPLDENLKKVILRNIFNSDTEI